MINIYVDESGNLGQNNDYFVIAMTILNNRERIKHLVKKFCARHNIDEIHTFCLSFVQKQFLINKLTMQQDYLVGYIIADKLKIDNNKLFESNNLLFNYLFSFLIKDIIKANTDDVSIYLDNRTQKVASINSLKDYIRIRAFTEWGFTKELNIQYVDSKDYKAIQIADLVANCIRRKYFHKNNDFYSRLNIIKSIKFPYKTFRDDLDNIG